MALYIPKLQKCKTGIQGLDEITGGGLPKGRTALVCGSAGCGKTLLSMQFLVNGAVCFEETGVFMSFEENETELAENFASLGVDLAELVAQRKISLDYVQFEKNEITETGEYDLEGLFIRLDYAINAIGAKRVVLDTIEALFSGLSDANILRAEMRRLFRWLKDKGVTTIITGEQGDGLLTRHGIEEYVSDCVILLDHKVVDQISTRRLRVIKYRGSSHGTNEYPFLIDEQGICVMPITSVGLNTEASKQRVATGIDRLDAMLGGQGFYEGSSVLVSGTAGTGKTMLACHIVDAACRRGEKCLYFAFEESSSQIIRNMGSRGQKLANWVASGNLEFFAARPTLFGLEMHLVSIYKKIERLQPQIIVLDPISNLISVGNDADVKLMLTRLLDFLKHKKVTAILLDLSSPEIIEKTNIGISSLIDTWIALRDIELYGERNKGLYVLKSRGMAHSNQIREFIIQDDGIDLLDVYTGQEGVLTGTARFTQEAREEAERIQRVQEIERKRREIQYKQQQTEVAIRELQADFERERAELEHLIRQKEQHINVMTHNTKKMAALRQTD